MTAIIFTYLACLLLTFGVLGSFGCIQMSLLYSIMALGLSCICFLVALGMWSDRDIKEKAQEIEIADLKQKVETLEGLIIVQGAEISNIEENQNKMR
mgnify:CR=1 FL=1